MTCVSRRPCLSPRRRPLAALSLSALLAGCMVGPDYAGPPRVAPLAQAGSGFMRARPSVVSAAPPLASWWTALNDPVLDHLETLALANSPDVERAAARIRAARATLGERRADLLPTGGVNATYIRGRLPDTTEIQIGESPTPGAGAQIIDRDLELYSLGGNASWEIDLFGGTRRKVASARNQLQASEADLQDAQVSLTKNVATAYVNLRAAQQRLVLARQSTAMRTRMLAIERERRRLGTASDVDVENAVQALKRTQGTEVPIAGQIEMYLDETAVLVGQEPGTLDARLAAPAATLPPALPLPPQNTPVGNPAELLRRRPDIRAAERRLAAANETIAADIAQYFPSVSLLGFLGFGSSSTGNLLSGKNLSAVGLPQLAWNFLNFPAIRAQVKGARADYAEQQAVYRQTVLEALQDANQALSRFGYQRDTVVTLADRRTSTERSVSLARLRQAGGTISALTLLQAEVDRVTAQDDLLRGQSELSANWITLQSALGLGWSTVPPEKR